MNTRNLWSRSLVIVGGIVMLLGAIDPLEGCLIILAGSACVLVGTLLSQAGQPMRSYWIATFVLMAVGVAAMFIIGAFGGIGGKSGHSLWWGVLILPYPIGWIMGMVSLLIRVVRDMRQRQANAA